MRNEKPLSAIIIIILSLMPFAIPLALLNDIHSTMITDSIPNHFFAVTAATLMLVSLVTYFNRRLLFKTKPMGGALTIVFAVSSFQLVFHSSDFYKTLYERYLFHSGDVYFKRTVVINKISRMNSRGGPSYFAQINPNGVSTIVPVITITAKLYYLLNTARLTAGDVSKDLPQRCSVSLMVNKSETNERIVWRTPADVSDVLECH